MRAATYWDLMVLARDLRSVKSDLTSVRHYMRGHSRTAGMTYAAQQLSTFISEDGNKLDEAIRELDTIARRLDELAQDAPLADGQMQERPL